MTPTGLSATPDSLTVTAGGTAKIKTTITPDTAPQTVTATTAGTRTRAARIFTTAATGPVNATVTPRLYKID